MKLSGLLYKRKISMLGLVLFIIASSVTVSYKISKWLIIKLIAFTKWFIRYIQFVRSGYSYSDICKMIQQLTGREFEVFCYELFKALNYNVKLTEAFCDGGKDLILYDKEKGYTYVECKRWSANWKVGRPEIQKLAGASLGDRVENMLFITTSDYTNEAYEYAKKIDNLELWDMDDIMRLVVKIDQKKLPLILTKTLGTNSKIIKLNPVSN